MKNVHAGKEVVEKGNVQRCVCREGSRDWGRQPANQINVTLTSVYNGATSLTVCFVDSSWLPLGVLRSHPPPVYHSECVFPLSFNGTQPNLIPIIMMIMIKTATCLTASGMQIEQAEGYAV